jgi:hypothetical protein
VIDYINHISVPALSECYLSTEVSKIEDFPAGSRAKSKVSVSFSCSDICCFNASRLTAAFSSIRHCPAGDLTRISYLVFGTILCLVNLSVQGQES